MLIEDELWLRASQSSALAPLRAATRGCGGMLFFLTTGSGSGPISSSCAAPFALTSRTQPANERTGDLLV